MSSMSALFCSLLNSTPSGTCGCCVSSRTGVHMGGQRLHVQSACEIFALPHPLLHDHPPIFGLCQKNPALSTPLPKVLNKLITNRVTGGITHNVVIRLYMCMYSQTKACDTSRNQKNTWHASSYKWWGPLVWCSVSIAPTVDHKHPPIRLCGQQLASIYTCFNYTTVLGAKEWINYYQWTIWPCINRGQWFVLHMQQRIVGKLHSYNWVD